MNKKYEIEENIFNEINNEEKAYFLGFLYADGYVNDKNKVVSLQLAEEDKEILNKLNKIIKSNRPLQFIDMGYMREKGMKAQDCYRLSINCSKIYKRIIELGCVPRKSLILKFPTSEQVPNQLIRHFIRGYFDGDGCIVVYFPSRRNGRTVQGDIKILSTKEFIEELGRITNKNLGITYNITKRIKDNSNCFNYQLSGNFQIIKFLEWIYKDCNIKMDRKFNKFLELINETNIRGKGKSKDYIDNNDYLKSLSK
jgi:intein/homing endonuclease